VFQLARITSIGQLHALQNLHLGGCLKLQQLPMSIGQLIALQKLNLSKWFNSQKLPTSIDQLISLQEFNLLKNVLVYKNYLHLLVN
jgi:Leucine-rich repeat (LRR) protein